MKYDYENLEKRIETLKKIRPPNPLPLIEEWLEGSKKELREKMEECAKDMKYSSIRMGLIGEYSLIKEILGDVE